MRTLPHVIEQYAVLIHNSVIRPFNKYIPNIVRAGQILLCMFMSNKGGESEVNLFLTFHNHLHQLDLTK